MRIPVRLPPGGGWCGTLVAGAEVGPFSRAYATSAPNVAKRRRRSAWTGGGHHSHARGWTQIQAYLCVLIQAMHIFRTKKGESFVSSRSVSRPSASPRRQSARSQLCPDRVPGRPLRHPRLVTVLKEGRP